MNKPGKIFKFILLGIILCFSFFNAAHAQHDSHSGESDSSKNAFDEFEQNFKESKTKESKTRFRGFSSFRSDLVSFCILIDKDGQLPWIYDKAEKYAYNLPECFPCKALYSSLKSTCKIKKKYVPQSRVKKPEAVKPDEKNSSKDNQLNDGENKSADTEAAVTKEEEPKKEESKKIVQLDPSTELLDLVSSIFREMSESKPKEEAENYFLAVSHLLKEMRDPENKTIKEKEYYSTLAAYIEAPFKSEGFLGETNSSINSSTSDPFTKPRTKLDDLF